MGGRRPSPTTPPPPYAYAYEDLFLSEMYPYWSYIMTIVRNIFINGMIFVFTAAILFLAAILDFGAKLQWAPNQVVFSI